jgi:hypothetical protein
MTPIENVLAKLQGARQSGAGSAPAATAPAQAGCPAPDRQAASGGLRRALELFLQRGDVVELRALNVDGKYTVFGYFNAGETLVAEALRLDGRAKGIYVTLNPVRPELLARAANRTRVAGKRDALTSDGDIRHRRWLPLDFDPVRPSGISATAHEKARAWERAREAVGWLRDLGWPAPVLADSGNGAHVLYRIDLPNDDASRELVRRCLETLALRLGDQVVALDTSVYNAARLWRLYGTMSRKGDHTPDRPHRRTQLLEVPEQLEPVPLRLLEALAALSPEPPQPAARRGGGEALRDIAAWLREHGLEVVRTAPWNGGRKWVLARCPWNPEHTDRSAFVVQFPGGALAAGCHHNSCRGRGWHDLRELLEPGRSQGASRRRDAAGTGEQAEAAWPRRQPLPDPLPVPLLLDELLPPPLRPWLLDVAERASIPLEFVAAPAIVGLGAVVGRAVGIQPARFDDYLVVPNLWGGIVGPPGWLKSHAVQEALRPLTRLEAEGHCQRQAEHLAREALTERLDAEIAALKEQMRRAAKPSKAGEPVGADLATLEAELRQKLAEREAAAAGPRRFFTQDATVEKLGELLQANPLGLLVLRDELSGWLRTLDKPGREGDREFYLESWNGTGSYTFDRIGRGTVYIPAVCVSIVGGITPGKLRAYIAGALSDGAGADGLLQRLQVLVWPDSIGAWRPVEHWPDSEARRRANAIYERLAGLDPIAVGATPDDERTPFLRFAPDAQELYDDWRTALENRLRGDEFAGAEAFQAHLSKYRSLMPALALLFHLVAVVAGEDEGGPVTSQATELATVWCAFLEAHARKVYRAELDGGADAARRLAEKIAQGRVQDGMLIRDIYRHGWSGLETPAVVDRALAVLSNLGWVRIETRASGRDGGRPGEIVRLHPELRGGAT